jgi:hypothetical protein
VAPGLQLGLIEGWAINEKKIMAQQIWIALKSQKKIAQLHGRIAFL